MMTAGIGVTFQVQIGVPFGARVSRVLRPIHGRGKFSNLSVVAGDILTAIDGKDVAGFPKNVLRHYLLGPPGTKVLLSLVRLYPDSKPLDFEVELEREFLQLKESGGQIEKWESVENEALRMQILLLREEAAQHVHVQEQQQQQIAQLRQSIESHLDALDTTKMLLIAANEQVSDHKEETEWHREELSRTRTELSASDKRLALSVAEAGSLSFSVFLSRCSLPSLALFLSPSLPRSLTPSLSHFLAP